jgi:hypothetical protein
MDVLANAREQNRLLASLPHDAQIRLRGGLESIPLDKGSSLWDAGDTIRYVYFPTAGLVSLMALSEGTVELATVNASIVGLPMLLRARAASSGSCPSEGPRCVGATTLRAGCGEGSFALLRHRALGQVAQAVIAVLSQCARAVSQLVAHLIARNRTLGTRARSGVRSGYGRGHRAD